MIRRFCDVCGVELGRNCVSDRLKTTVARPTHVGGTVGVLVEVVCGVDGVWNSGDICEDCLLEAVAAVTGPDAVPVEAHVEGRAVSPFPTVADLAGPVEDPTPAVPDEPKESI